MNPQKIYEDWIADSNFIRFIKLDLYPNKF